MHVVRSGVADAVSASTAPALTVTFCTSVAANRETGVGRFDVEFAIGVAVGVTGAVTAARAKASLKQLCMLCRPLSSTDLHS